MGKRNKRQQGSLADKGSPSSAPTRLEANKNRKTLEFAILILAIAGTLLTAYLTVTESMAQHPAFCSEGSGCDIVQSSRWATFLGVPMALWGCLTYLTMAGLAWRAQTKPGSWTPLMFVAIGGFAISAYLTIISVVEIEATCPYCLASFAIITTIMILTIAKQPADWQTTLKEALIMAALIVLGLHLHYSGVFDSSAGPEDPQLKALAIHLQQSGAKFYGAYWCPRCQEQKALFGSSAKRLPYVECSSGGRGSPLTPPCVKHNIRSFPTWIIGEKRLTGLMTPKELADATGFAWKE